MSVYGRRLSAVFVAQMLLALSGGVQTVTKNRWCVSVEIHAMVNRFDSCDWLNGIM